MNTKIRPCACCGRLTRPAGTRAVNFPDTIIRSTTTLCGRCYERGRMHRDVRVKGACSVCDTEMVESGCQPGPGQRAYGAHGKCRRCHHAELRRLAADRKGLETPLDQITDPQVRHNRQGLESMLKARRERLARLAA